MNDGVDKLKELLFDRETETLGDLARRIELVAETERLSHAELKTRLDDLKSPLADLKSGLDSLAARAVTGEQLTPRVAAVLADVIREAEEVRHDDTAHAIAPLVVRTIKTELRNSQDEMVEVLYPITGRMVKAFVASAINDMMAKINRRLEANPFMLRVRSVLSGRPVSELALIDAERLTCDELYLIRRGAGALVGRWPESKTTANIDSHVGGVLTAINEFAVHTFKDDGGNVREFALDDFTIYLRASPLYLLAAKCRGTPVPGLQDAIDREFLDVIEALHAGGAVTAPDKIVHTRLASLAQLVDARVADAHAELARAGLPFSPLKALVAAIVLPLVGLAGWFAYTSWEVNETRRAAQTAIEETAELSGYPLQLDVGPRGQSLSLGGLAPSSSAKTALLARLERDLPAVAMRDRITLLPNQPADPAPQIAAVRRQLSSLEADLVTASVRRALDRAQRRLDNALVDLGQLSASTDERRRRLAGAVARSVEQAARELTTYRTVTLGAPSDAAALVQLQAPLDAMLAALTASAASLNGLIGVEPPRAPAPAPAPAASAAPSNGGVATIAEDVALVAERLATVAAAAAQTSAIRIPEPPPPPPPPRGPTPREELLGFARANAVFFGNADEYRNAAQAEQVLDRLAALMAATDDLLRIVGYTDDRGAPQRNNLVAQSRAERVLADLEARGVPRARMVAVGRPNGLDLSPITGVESPNRRVEFELGFAGEASGTRP